MKASVFAISALSLGSLVGAAPLKVKREDVVWVTQLEVVTEVVELTTTVWVNDLPTPAPAPEPSPSAPNGEFFEKPKEQPKPVISTTALAPSTTPSPVQPIVMPTPVAPVPEVPVVKPTPPAAKPTPPAPAPPPPPPPPAPSPTPSAPSSNEGSSASGQAFSGGDITYYDPSGGYGSCGTTISNDDNVVALPFGMMDKISSKSNGHPWCGKQVAIYFGGKTFTATVQDKCMGCKDNDIDMTSGLFKKICGDAVDGRGKGLAKWAFIN